MKVLLLNPPADNGVRQVREGRCMQRAGAWTAIWTPLSLAYCAAVLRDDGFGVDLIDAIIDEVSFDGVEKAVAELRPEVVVINAVTPSIVSDLSAASSVKKIDPNIRTAVIGIHGSALPEETLRLNSDADFIVMNEPEMIVRDLCRAVRDGADASTVKGLAFMKNGAAVVTEKAPLIDDLDSLPYPAYDLIHTEKYLLPFSSKRFLLVASGRGCGHGCVFCADHVYYGRKVRLRKPEKLVEELKHWKETLGVRDFLFWSESFTLNREFSCAVARRIIETGLDVSWVCNSRVDDMDDDMPALFKKAGCSMIGYGVESGDDKTLAAMNKRITTGQIRHAVEAAKRHGIETVAHTILGFPGETEETVRKTIAFVKSLPLDYAQFYCAVPFPGSKLYEHARENGWIASDDWRMFEQNFSVLKTEALDPEKVMELRNFAYRSFFLRPKMIAALLKKLYSQGGLLRAFSIIRDFAGWI